MLRPPGMQEDVHGPPAADARERTGLCLLPGGLVPLNPVLPVQTKGPVHNENVLRSPPHAALATMCPPGGIFLLLT